METVGQRLRRLRQAAGLSQSDLASAIASASYVSLVESDKRTPGPEVVEHLATTLGCTVDYLLTGTEATSTASARMDLTFAALALAEGHPSAALTRLQAIELQDLPEDLCEQVQEKTAKALLGVGALEQGIELLEPLLDKAHRAGRTLQALTLATTLAASYLEAGDLVRAVEVAEENLRAGREARLEQTTEHVRLIATLSWALNERGDLHYARQRIREVLPAVEATGDAKARGSLYWNAAIFAQEAGHEAEAVDLTRRALALIAEHSDQADLARLRVTLGWLLLRGSDADPSAALAELRAAEPDITQYASTIDLAYCLVEQARALLLTGELSEALKHGRRALDMLRPQTAEGEIGEAPRFFAVQAHLVLADILDALEDHQAATDHYTKAADMLGMMTTGRKAAEIWGTLATRLRDRGSMAEAMQAYDRAIKAAGIQVATATKSQSPQSHY